MTEATRRQIDNELRAIAGDAFVHADEPLAPLTTFRIGGPADWRVDVGSVDTLVAVLRLAAEADVPVTMIGGVCANSAMPRNTYLGDDWREKSLTSLS